MNKAKFAMLSYYRKEKVKGFAYYNDYGEYEDYMSILADNRENPQACY